MTTNFDKLLEDFLAAADDSSDNPAIRSLRRKLDQKQKQIERKEREIERKEEDVARVKDDQEDLKDDVDDLQTKLTKEVGDEVL